jgi:hypothetical protein
LTFTDYRRRIQRVMTSTAADTSRRALPTPLVILIAGAIGALVSLVLALLTFGVQATVSPHQMPLAVGPSDTSAASALSQITDQVASQGGDAVAWRKVGSRSEAEALLDNKEIYGALLFSLGPSRLQATVLLSGGVNANATQIAQPVLSQVAAAVVSAARSRSGGQTAGAAPAVEVVTLHPTSAAGRILPLAASAILWLAALVTNIVSLVLGPRLRGGRPLGSLSKVGAAVTGAVLGTGVVLGLGLLWDSGLPLGWEVAGFLVLVGSAFGLLQAGVLRWLGLAGMAVLGPLYLMAPAVAALPSEVINPVYRALLWSWTPFRFSTEGLRSLMFVGSGAPDVPVALWLFAGIGLLGLLLAVGPGPRNRVEA